MVERKNRTVPGRAMSIEWVADRFDVSRKTLLLYVKEGLLDFDQEEGGSVFSPEMIDRVRMIVALRNDLGVNMAGIEIILRLRHQLIWQKNRFREPFGDSLIDIDM